MLAKRRITIALTAAAALLAALQLVPYGHGRTHPPDGAQVSWDTPGTRALAERACFDCHSNHTRWPWYARLAPVSWRIQHHVDEGRSAINFTAFAPGAGETGEAAGEAGETVTKGEMPPADYLLLHPEARLSPAERQALAAGLDATFAAWREGGGGAPADSARGGRDERGEGGERGEAKERGEGGERDRD